MTTGSSVAPLLDVIRKETHTLESFASLLKDEQKLLIAGNADEITPLLQSKSQLANTLGELGQQREKALQELHVAVEPSAVQAFVQKQTPEFRTAWQKLIDMAREANQINATNGKLINTRLQHNQQALNVLLTAAAGGVDTATYGPDGQQKHSSGPRKLGSA